jgi:hypothetical protein
MKIAERIARLGTETAFAVSAEAAAFASQGNKVYPFHLGDMNIITPANVMEATIKAMMSAPPMVSISAWRTLPSNRAESPPLANLFWH